LTSATLEQQFERYGPAYRWLVTLAGMIGAMTMVLSATMVNVAVPSIMGAFGVGQDMAQWAATAFIATMVASQLLNTWMVQAFGQRLAYTMTLVIFIIGSFVCLTSPTIEVLIIGRIMQGFSAGVIQPLVMATIISVFPADRRGFAMGLYGMGVTLAPSFGPLAGGITIDALTWRHIFIAPLPLVAIAFSMGLVFMPGKKFSRKLPDFDWTGFILLGTALVCLMTGVGNGQRWGWGSDGIMMLFMIGLIAASGFVYWQAHARAPLLDLTLFLNPRFASVMIIAFAFGAGNFATNYAIPVFTQAVQGFTPTKAGMVLVPAGLLLVTMIPFSGRLADRVPPHLPLMTGVALFAFAVYLLSFSDVNSPFVTIALLAVVSRFGLGLVMPNMGAAAMRTIPHERLNKAAGAYNFTRQLGGAFGVNCVVAITEYRAAFHADALTATQTSSNVLSRELIDKVERVLADGGLPEAAQQSGALNFLGSVIHAQAITLGFQDAFLVICIVFIATLIPAYMIKRTK
jgi:MFS transporter, DHA2 family, multidrug resistance protein